MIAKRIFEKLGHQVTLAVDRNEVLDILKEEMFDILFMDVLMPVLGGFETTRKIREAESDKSNARYMIIAVTALDFNEDKKNCQSAGMDGFISKPMRLEEFRRILDEFLKIDESGIEGSLNLL